MLKGLFFSAVGLILFYLGAINPAVWAIGYVWADIASPSLIAHWALNFISFNVVFGVLALFGLLRLNISARFWWTPALTITVLYGIWMTLTLGWSVYYNEALTSWNYAIKAVVFAILLPFFINTQRAMEALLWTIVTCLAMHASAWALKLMAGGTSYGVNVGLSQRDANYTESSTLGMLAVSIIPFVLFLAKHQTVFTNGALARRLAYLVAFLMVAASVATNSRTGLICIVVLAGMMIIQSGRKFSIAVFIVLSAAVLYLSAPDTWLDRMSTVDDKNDVSSMGRVAVWQWTIDYVAQNPLGGGFGIWRSSSWTLPLSDGNELKVFGKAFHSIYFEVLGSLGYVGFILYLGMYFAVIVGMRKVARNSLKKAEDLKSSGLGQARTIESYNSLIWCADLSRANITALLIFLAGGAFIGVAFSPYPLYLCSISAIVTGLYLKMQDKTL